MEGMEGKAANLPVAENSSRCAPSLLSWRAMTQVDSRLQQWLEAFVQTHEAVAGTVHLRAADDPDHLHLAAAHNIPPKVLEVTSIIPRGKGMAGLALERDAPVSTCNLSTDETGDVRPGAKAVAAQAAVALPIHDESGSVRAVVGVAWMGERDISPEELAALTEAAGSLPRA